MRRGGTVSAFASRYWLIPSGRRNSSCKISPGAMGGIVRPRPRTDRLVVVDDLDILCVTVLPAEAHPPLVVDANAVWTRAIPRQLLGAIAKWNPEIFERFSHLEVR